MLLPCPRRVRLIGTDKSIHAIRSGSGVHFLTICLIVPALTPTVSSIPGETGGGIGGETFTLTTGVDTFNGTANNDVFQAILSGGADNTVNPFDALNGNGGTDTLNVIVQAGANNGFNGTTIQNIEVVNLNQATGVVANLSAASFVGATQIWQIGDATDIVGVGANTTVGFRNTAAGELVGADDSVTFTGATGSIALDNVASGSGVEVLEVTANTLSTLNVSGNVAGAGAFEIALAGNVAGVGDVDTLNLSLSSNGTIDIDTLTDLETINLSGSTGNITLQTGAFTQDVTVTLGSGNDTVTLVAATDAEFTVNGGAGNDNITGGVNNDTLNGDAGNDIINGLAGDDVINGGAGNDVIRGGVGADNITTGAGNDVVAYAVGDSTWEGDRSNLDVITDFNAEGNDTIDLTAIAGLVFSTAEERINAQNAVDLLGDDADLGDALDAVAANIDAGDVAWFTFGENTYVYVEGPELVVELTGSVALGTADFALSTAII